MKKVVLIFGLSILFISFKINNDSELLYEQALLNHYSNHKTDKIYVLKCSDIELKSKVGKHTIVDISDNIKSYCGKDSSLYAIKLLPIESNKGNFEITIIDYLIKIHAGEITMSNAGSVIYRYKYEGSKNRYKMIKKIKYTF